MADQEKAPQKTFEELDAEGRTGFFTEFVYFLNQNKKWWLLPILLVLALFGLLMLLSATAVAPFIYTFF